MSATEYPAQTDAEQIKTRLASLETAVGEVLIRLDGHAMGINSIGENVQWLVQNLQGLFQMFASPQFMSQMSNMITGAMQDGERAADPASESASGT